MDQQFSPEQQALINSYSREAGVPAGPFIEQASKRLQQLAAINEAAGEAQRILTFGGGGISHAEPAWHPWVPRAALLQNATVVNVDPARQSEIDLSKDEYHAISGNDGDIVSLFKSRFNSSIHKLLHKLPESVRSFQLITADRLLGKPELIAPELFARMISEGAHARSMEISRDIHLASLVAHLKLVAVELLEPGGIFAMDDQIYRAHNHHLYKVTGFD